tara:strand:- start:2116 stop:2460 length:345 start_codon:yes stop_codon:yes gene_type:complete
MRFPRGLTDEMKPHHAPNQNVLKKQKDYSVPTTKEILRELKQSFPGVLNKLPKNPKKSVIKAICIKTGVLHSIDERVALKRALVSRKIDFKSDSPTYELVSLAMSKKLNFDTIG